MVAPSIVQVLLQGKARWGFDVLDGCKCLGQQASETAFVTFTSASGEAQSGSLSNLQHVCLWVPLNTEHACAWITPAQTRTKFCFTAEARYHSATVLWTQCTFSAAWGQHRWGGQSPAVGLLSSGSTSAAG